MPRTGAAAPTRVLVGPLSTQGGFQYWYMVCFPDCMVAVPQGIGAFFALGISNSVGRAVGPIGVLVKYLLQPRALAFRQRIEATLQSTPSLRLRGKPNVVFPTTQLKAISYTLKKGAPLFASDLILETKTGNKQRYGVVPADFEKVASQLKQMYPTLVKSI
jgi:hypothetical protein